jgi:hypothetical protein
MLLLDAPFEAARSAVGPPPWGALAQVAAPILALISAGLVLEHHGGTWAALGRALSSGAAHGGLLAVGWVMLTRDGRAWVGPVVRLTGLVLVASLASRLSPWGTGLYLLVPIGLIAEARRRPDVAAQTLRWPTLRAAVLGAGAGTFLGAHLLATSGLTFGYEVRIDSVGGYLAAAAYDAGVSAVTAEWLFRGALFSEWWRRWSFVPAAALSTALAMVRYLSDLNLPPATEAWLGAALYTGLLGAAACALRAWSESLVPGYLATLGFLIAYRALGH